MSDSSQPTDSTSNLVEQTQSTSQASSSGGCETRKFCCRCCKVFLWLFCIAVVLAAVVFIGWRLLSPKYTAKAYLRVAYRENPLVYPNRESMNILEYEIFKNTQEELIKNRYVLTAALHKPEETPISRLPILKKQDDPVAWLINHIKVKFPGKSEIMEISFTTYDREEAALIVNAVVEAYMSEVVDVERDHRRMRLSELDRLFTDKDQEIRSKRIELKQLAEQLGTAEAETLNLKQMLTLKELDAHRQELIRSEFEVGKLRSELASRRAELESVKNAEVSDLECEMFAQNDPVLKNLIQEIMYLKKDKQYSSTEAPQDDKSTKDPEKIKTELERTAKEYAERLDQVRNEILRKRQADVEMKIKEVEAEIDVAVRQQKANEDDVLKLRKLAEQFGYSSVDVEMLRADIVNREKSLESIGNEREKLKVELRAASSRVTPLQQKSQAEKRPAILWFIP